MKQLKGYSEAKVISGGFPQLPKGGYIAKIMGCEEKTNKGYRWLEISFDIAEGDHKGHFAEQYRANTNEDKKWRGIYNAFIPDESSKYYEDNLNRFKTMMTNIEDSNEGYHWDWEEKTLKGKMCGVLFGEKEFETVNGDVIILTECRGIRSVECIREGKYKIPALKTLNKSSAPSAAGYTPVSTADDDDLPF